MVISSSEFIKGYTKIIICANLFKQRNYLYKIVKQIITDGKGIIKISNPSALIIMKQLEEEGLVSSTVELSEQNQARKYYFLTEKGKVYYLNSKELYVDSVELLKKMIRGD